MISTILGFLGSGMNGLWAILAGVGALAAVYFGIKNSGVQEQKAADVTQISKDQTVAHQTSESVASMSKSQLDAIVVRGTNAGS